MRWTLTRAQAVAVTLLAVALLVDAVLTIHHVREVATGVQWVSHTHEVLGKLEEVLSTLKDAETGQRGYLLTGERPYLEPHDQAVARLQTQLVQLRQLTIDNPVQTAHVLKLEQLAARRLALLRQGLEHVGAESDRSRALVIARQHLLEGLGKRAMDLVRDEVYGMQHLERDLLQRREAASRVNARFAIASTVVGLSLGLALIAMVTWLFARNLATRQRAADVMHAERERFRTTLTSIGDAVIVTDSQGRVTLLNPVAQALTRWSDEAVGQPLEAVFRIVNEATRAPVENPVATVIRRGTVVGLANHTVLIAKDGAEVAIDDSGAPIRDARGRVVGVVLVFRDVTERRRVERALEDADQRKDEFLAMLAHELRNPLAPIRNAAHTLGLIGTSDERVRWVSGVIERQVGLMTRLVDDLLDVSRITSGQITLQRKPVAVRAVLDQAMEIARPAAENRSQALEIDGGPADAGWVDGDPARLAQVVGNLLDNAIKYTDDGGRIRLTARAEAAEVVIAVQDTGAGIHPDLLPHVFDLFTQADRSLERRQGGLGIGLTLVRRLVEMHGGRVEATSDGPGRGSEFTIRLPRLATDAAPPEAVAEEAAPADRPAGPARRVLVVDDEPDSTDSLALFLRLRGHEVRVAHDGPGALEEISRYRPDVVFLDLGLPGMNGYDVARRVRMMSDLGPLRLVALTGYGTDGDRQKTRDAGFDVHLAKPVDPQVLDALLASSS
ncbi:MAG: CHASE3 domain-containing protein [Candidatus Rokuibacteriota bacterium]